MIKRFLRSGVEEDGSVMISDEGTPQCGVISPLLANIYLHYALDLWFEKVYGGLEKQWKSSGKAVEKLLFKWLNRRGKRNCLNWEKFERMLKRFPLPKPRIRVSMFNFSVN